MTADQAAWIGRVRGLLLGLALGDAVGSRTGPTGEVLRAGVSTQLAAFTVEGLIRASVRADHKGICHPPTVLWHAYHRWAYVQGIEPQVMTERWSAGSSQWPDGWLSQVSALAQRRGSAPATVNALALSAKPGTLDRPITNSGGSHALTRTLPAAVVLSHGGGGSDLVRDLAALTHGDKDAQDAAAFVAAAAAGALGGAMLDDAVNQAFDSSSDGGGIAMAMDEAQVAANKKPADISLLQEIAPSASALSAARGGIYTALSYQSPGQVTDALTMARNAPHPTSVAAVAGGLLGALHGVHALPVQLISKLELAWVMDTLARDLTTQLLEHPSGTQDTAASDPSWWSRYPGW